MASSPERGAGQSIEGRTAVVTGATGGIGGAVARRLAAGGAEVVVVARTARRVQETAAALGCTGVAADAATEAGIERIVAAVESIRPGGADIVVNAAGAFDLAPLAETDTGMFDRMVAVNLRSPFLLIRAFLPAMLQRGTGHVVTIGSVAGRRAFASNGAYGASKFGVRGLHAVLDAELRGTGVRATLIEPAATDTLLWEAIDRERNEGLPPRSTMLSADAVADAVLYAVTRPMEVAIPNILVERA